MATRSKETPAEAVPRTRRTRTRAAGDGMGDGPDGPAAMAIAPTATRGGRAGRETFEETAARRKQEKEVDKLQADLRAFALARPAGWGHEDWVGFLSELGTRGHDVSDAEGIGARLEQERLAVVLGSVAGLGPKRVQSMVDRFHTLWSLRHAGVDEIAAVPGMTRPLASRVADDLVTRYS